MRLGAVREYFLFSQSTTRAQRWLPKSLFLHRRGALPVADVDDDPFWPFVFIFVVRRSQIHRTGLGRAGGFKQPELFLIVVGGKTDVIDTGLTAHARRLAAAL